MYFASMNYHLDHKVAAGSAASLEVQNIGTVIYGHEIP